MNKHVVLIFFLQTVNIPKRTNYLKIYILNYMFHCASPPVTHWCIHCLSMYIFSPTSLIHHNACFFTYVLIFKNKIKIQFTLVMIVVYFNYMVRLNRSIGQPKMFLKKIKILQHKGRYGNM